MVSGYLVLTLVETRLLYILRILNSYGFQWCLLVLCETWYSKMVWGKRQDLYFTLSIGLGRWFFFRFLVSILPAICLNWGVWCASIEAHFCRKMERSYVGNRPWATQKMVSAMVINKSYSTRTKVQWWCFILLIMNRAFYSCVWWSISCHP